MRNGKDLNTSLPIALCAWILICAHDGFAQQKATRVIFQDYKFDVPRVEVTQEPTQLTFAGADILNRPGEPPLPVRTARILLPPGYRLEKVQSISIGEPVLLSGCWLLEQGRFRARPYEPDQVSQASGANSPSHPSSPASLQPAERARLASVQRWFGCDIAIVQLFPIQYAVASGELTATSHLRVVITLVATPGESNPTPSTCRQTEVKERIKAFVDNPAMIDEHSSVVQAKPASKGRCDYLLITRQALAPSFQPLLDSKTMAGVSPRIETVEAIASQYRGRDLPEKIRNYICYAYKTWGVQYVLLGGDVDTVPCRYASGRMNEKEVESRLPCDMYFACLDGSWNRDGDARWGEPTDGEDGGDVDLMAEVWVGRAPVDTPEEIARFVGKTLCADKGGQISRPKILFLAEYLGRYSGGVEGQGGDMFDPLSQRLNGLPVTWLDDRPHLSSQWGKADAVAALNRSPNFVLYNGHADADILMRLRRDDLDDLTNASPFLIYSVGCHAGRFDNDRFSPDSIAEEFIKRNCHGAFAAIINPRLGWFDPQTELNYSGEYQAKFFDAVLMSGEKHLGTLHQDSKHRMIGRLEVSGTMPYRWCYYELTLLGDPHATVRFGEKALGERP